MGQRGASKHCCAQFPEASVPAMCGARGRARGVPYSPVFPEFDPEPGCARQRKQESQTGKGAKLQLQN